MDIKELQERSVVYKTKHDGWKAETHLPIDVGDEKIRSLDITTSKRGHAINTTVTCCSIKENGWTTYVIFEDFFCVYKTVQARCTEKRISDQHFSIFSEVDQIIQDVKDYYQRKNTNG